MNCALSQDDRVATANRDATNNRDATVSVLFVDPKGLYPELVVDTWDAARDARLYDGPNPVVAHPPCQLWVNLAHVNYKRYGGGHNRPGNDGGCFASALHNVRRWGGVLEHPAKSNAWAAHGLTAPGVAVGWRQTALCEWVCEVWQSAYGHKARQEDVALLLRSRPAARCPTRAHAWNASGRMVRSDQADARKEGSDSHAGRLRAVPRRSGASFDGGSHGQGDGEMT